ncbi:fibronectin type III domain-containing protein [Paenibacillus sp. S-38]|uniref:fibronectin type III domain-containing protein n=1 Tax=Paenibacillus sp. S-38 TaxID=3416710 RepID=UPI003CF4E208
MLWLSCMLSLLWAAGVQAEGAVFIRIDSPYPNVSFDRVLPIRASTYSELEAVRAVAKVEDRETELAYSCEGGCEWRGQLPLEGLTKGAKLLTVVVTDALGGTSTKEAPFYYNSAPVLTKMEPGSESVVTDGRLHVTASAEDDSSVPEVRVTVTGNFSTIAEFSGQGSVDETIDVSAYAGQVLEYSVVAEDEQGAQSLSVRHKIHVTSDPRNVPVESVQGRIIDFDLGRYLLERVDAGGYALIIRNRADGTETVIATRSEFNNRMGLTPAGALFIQSPGTSNFVHYWADGELTRVPYSMRSLFQTKGNYALFDVKSAPYPFVLFDTSVPGAPAETFSTAYEVSELTEDGAFFYAEGDQIYRHPLRGTAELYLSGYENIRGMSASGGQLIFHSGLKLYSYDGSSVEEVAQTLPDGSRAHRDYELNGGWIAYMSSQDGGTELVLRTPEGAVTKVASVSDSAEIKQLAGDGRLVYTSGERIYIYRPGEKAPVSAGTEDRDNVKVIDGTWYKSIGNTLFRFEVAGPDTEGPSWPEEALSVTGVTYRSAVLQWLPAEDGRGVASYRIYRDGEHMATVAGDVYSYEDDTLAPSTTYEFSVEAWDAAGNRSTENPAVTVTTSAYQTDDTSPPAWPAGSELAVTDVTYSSAQLSWPAAEDDRGVAAYLIYRDGQLQDTVGSAVYRYDAAGLQAGTAYRFTVAARDAAGNVSEAPLAAAVTTGVYGPDPAGRLTLGAKPGFLEVGSVLEVNVQADEAADLYAFLAKLSYDPARFKLMQVKLQESFGREGDTAVIGQSRPAANQANVTGSLLGDVPGRSGRVGLLTLKFTVLQKGAGSLALESGSTLSDSQGRTVLLDTPVRLTVQVGGADLDGDGTAGLSDLVLIAKFSGTKAGEPGYRPEFDLNHSGAVDTADVEYVAKAVAAAAH